MFTKLFDGHLVKQYAIVIGVNLSLLGTGMNLSWPSPILVKLRNIDQTVLDRLITEEEGSWIVSIGNLLAVITNIFPAVLMDRIGRKYCVIMGVIPKIVGGVFLLFASDIWMLLLGKAINGSGDAILFCSVPTYALEIASKEIRGALSTILQVMCSLGTIVNLTVGPFVSYVTMNIIFVATMVFAAIPLIFIPDSPYFLFIKGKRDDAFRVLKFLRGSKAAAEDEIKEYSTETGENKKDILEIAKDRMFLKPFLLVATLQIGSQITGFTAVSFYLQTILESAGTSVRPDIASVIIGCIQLAASFFTLFLTDKFGRRPILITNLSGIVAGMVGLGTFFYATEDADVISGFMNFLPLMSLILIIFCYSSGPGSTNWAVSAELFDNTSRALGISICFMLSNASVFITARFFAPLMVAIGPAATYWMFSAVSALLCAFVYFFIPETKGRTIAEIQYTLGTKQEAIDGEKGDK